MNHLITKYLLLAMVLLTIFAQSAKAATATTTFLVTAEIGETCSVSATNLAFGSYDPSSGTPTDSTNTVTVTCTNGTAYAIGLNAGTASGATVTTRQMTGSPTADLLDYSLYNDSARTTNWDDIGGSGAISVGSASGVAEAHTVYGRIPINQFLTSGNYQDTITVTVSY